jgi:hypothetical protein
VQLGDPDQPSSQGYDSLTIETEFVRLPRFDRHQTREYFACLGDLDGFALLDPRGDAWECVP